MKTRNFAKIALILSAMVLLFALLCSSVAAATVPPVPAEYTRSGSIIKNEYLELRFNNNELRAFHTVAGNPESSTDNNKRLLYGDLSYGTSYTYLNIDGNVVTYRATNSKINADASSTYSSMTVNGVYVEQIMSFVYNAATQREDIVEFKYVFTNVSNVNKSAGVRIMFDTMLGSNDSAPFRIPGIGDVTTEREFTGAAIPKTWQAFDSLTSPTVVASGTFYNSVTERPDKVQFILWPTACDAVYNCSVSGRFFGDSAVNVYYDPDVLAPGESRTVRTFYGLSAFAGDVAEGEVDLRVIEPPTSLAVGASGTTYENNPFTLNTWVMNGTFDTVTNLTAKLTLPEGLELVGQESEIHINSLASGGEQNISWYIMAKPQYENTTLRYTLTLSGDGFADIVKDFSVYLPKIACDHREGGWIVDRAATCEEEGLRHTECSVCGEVVRREILSALAHVYGTTPIEAVPATCTTDGYAVYKCVRDGCAAQKRQILFAYGHDFGGDNVCDECGYTVIVHTHSYSTNTVAPTCTQVGYTEYTCSCGHTYRDDLRDQLGHRWDGGRVVTEKTCLDAGLVTVTCTVCDAYYNEVIPAGHDWTEYVEIEATCTTDGSLTRVCNTCGTSETEVIPAAHAWVDVVGGTPATCEEGGTQKRACSVCGAEEFFEIPELGHRFVNGACTRCGATIPDIIRPNVEHPNYGMYFEIDDILSAYGPEIINEYGLLLDYNANANIKKVGVYLTQDGTMWRRCIACTGEGIDFATYVPYLSYGEDIKYTGLNSAWINTFSLRKNSDGIWCYNNYATIGVNLTDSQGNLLLSLYDIGQAGAKTRIFTDLDEMIAWLKDPSDPTDPTLPQEPAIVISEAETCPGQTVTVEVSFENMKPVKSLALMPVYNTEYLELISAKWAGKVADEAVLKSNWNASRPEIVPAAAFDENLEVNGTVFVITFKVKEGAPLDLNASVSLRAVIKEADAVGEEQEITDYVYRGGFVRIAHSYTVSAYDEDMHWTECAYCGGRVNEQAHEFDNACDATCAGCNYERTVNHAYATEWSWDVSAHWHECPICHDKTDVTAHSFDHNCDTTCNECGYIRTITHDYKVEWTADGNEHWHECRVCGDKTDRASHAWDDGVLVSVDTAAGTGVKLFTCTVCEAEREEDVTVYRIVIEDRDAYKGRIVKVKMTFDELPAAKSLVVYDISYDETALELLEGVWTADGAEIFHFNLAEKLGTVAFDENVSLADVTLTLTFRVREDAAGGEYTIDCNAVAKEMTGGAEKMLDTVVLPGTISVCPFLRGDVNGDGRVNSDDAIYLLLFTLMPADYPINQDGDMDGNGRVNSDDAIYLLLFTLMPNDYPLHPLD